MEIRAGQVNIVCELFLPFAIVIVIVVASYLHRPVFLSLTDLDHSES